MIRIILSEWMLSRRTMMKTSIDLHFSIERERDRERGKREREGKEREREKREKKIDQDKNGITNW